jgi:hypothetical protein
MDGTTRTYAGLTSWERVRKTRKKKQALHDDQEKELVAAHEGGEASPVKHQKRAKQAALKAARRKTLEEFAAYDQELEI